MKQYVLIAGLFIFSMALTVHAAFLNPPVFVHAKSGFGESTYQFDDQGNGIYKVIVPMEKGTQEILVATKDKACQYPLKTAEKLIFNNALAMKVCAKGGIVMRTFKAADYEFTFDNTDADRP